jgi:hypothetical protein
MSEIFALAGLNASDYAYLRNADQQLVFDTTNQYIEMANQAHLLAMSAFVDPTPTTVAKERFKLPMTGRMQRVSEISAGKSVATYGGNDVAYPLENYMDRLALSDVDAAYLDPGSFQAHVDGMLSRAAAAKRHEILRRLFKNTDDTFVDPRLGSLTVVPLADGGAELYPVEGSDSLATDTHHLESGYAAADISDTNNPYETLVNELVEHGTNMTDDVPVVAFIHPDQQNKTEALTNFVPYIPSQIAPGADTDDVLMPSRPIPGKVIGYIRGLCWVSVWRWVPTNYILATNLEGPAPLKMRVDPVETGLGNGGLILLPEERHGQLTFNSWRLRFGIGTANRVGAAVMELGTGGTYGIPTEYA